MIGKGEQSGEIVRDGKILLKQFDLFCLRHSHPKKMVQVITQEEDGMMIYGKACQRCHQYYEEGRFKDIDKNKATGANL